jgi:hypothetical protein
MRAGFLCLAMLACSGGEPAAGSGTPSIATSSPTTSPSAPAAASASSSASLPPDKEAKLSAAAFLRALEGKADGLGMSELKRFTADDDPNKLLGRPGQYVEKLSWKVAGDTGTIEFYTDLEAAKSRADFVREAGKKSPLLLQWVYLNEKRLAVLRLPHKVSPDDAKKWEAILASI